MLELVRHAIRVDMNALQEALAEQFDQWRRGGGKKPDRPQAPGGLFDTLEQPTTQPGKEQE